jgi:hypothetical protein
MTVQYALLKKRAHNTKGGAVMSRLLQWFVLVGALALFAGTLPAVAADKQPNIWSSPDFVDTFRA